MEARQPFSRLGWALFAQMAVMLAAQWGCCFWPGRHGPACWESRCFCGRRPSWGPTGWGFPPPVWCCGDGGPARPGPPPAGAGPLRGPLGRLRGAGLSGEWGYPAPHRPAGAAPGRGGGQPGGVHRPLPPSAPAPAGRAHRPCGGGTSVPQAAAAPPAALWGALLRWWPPPFASACFTEI